MSSRFQLRDEGAARVNYRAMEIAIEFSNCFSMNLLY